MDYSTFSFVPKLSFCVACDACDAVILQAGKTALAVAVQAGDESKVTLLLNHGANADASDKVS